MTEIQRRYPAIIRLLWGAVIEQTTSPATVDSTTTAERGSSTSASNNERSPGPNASAPSSVTGFSTPPPLANIAVSASGTGSSSRCGRHLAAPENGAFFSHAKET
jgi:hypothetical protein